MNKTIISDLIYSNTYAFVIRYPTESLCIGGLFAVACLSYAVAKSSIFEPNVVVAKPIEPKPRKNCRVSTVLEGLSLNIETIGNLEYLTDDKKATIAKAINNWWKAVFFTAYDPKRTNYLPSNFFITEEKMTHYVQLQTSDQSFAHQSIATINKTFGIGDQFYQ